jgi:hypothetical protein
MAHPRTREIRLRNTAKRRGLELHRSRRRDPNAIGHGCWCLVDRYCQRAAVLAPGSYRMVAAPEAHGGIERFASWVPLDAIERMLLGQPQVASDAIQNP